MTILVVLVAGGSAAAMWQVLSNVARGERITAEAGWPLSRRAWRCSTSISAASRLEDAITALLQVLPDEADVLEMRRLVEAVKVPRVRVIVLARKCEQA